MTVIWWIVFPVCWILLRYGRLSAVHRRTMMVGTTLVGSVLVIVGAWMAWPWYSPLYAGFRVGISVPSIERGYQIFDLPLVALAIVGGFGVVRYRNQVHAPLIALGIGLSVFLVATGITRLWGGGFWVFNWGFYITLGGAVGLVYAGLFGLLSFNKEQYATMDRFTT